MTFFRRGEKRRNLKCATGFLPESASCTRQEARSPWLRVLEGSSFVVPCSLVRLRVRYSRRRRRRRRWRRR